MGALYLTYAIVSPSRTLIQKEKIWAYNVVKVIVAKMSEVCTLTNVSGLWYRAILIGYRARIDVIIAPRWEDAFLLGDYDLQQCYTCRMRRRSSIFCEKYVKLRSESIAIVLCLETEIRLKLCVIQCWRVCTRLFGYGPMRV